MKQVKIEEIVTFIKPTRAEAMALAVDMGGAEIHALYLQRGFGAPSAKPVGYLVLPLKNKSKD